MKKKLFILCFLSLFLFGCRNDISKNVDQEVIEPSQNDLTHEDNRQGDLDMNKLTLKINDKEYSVSLYQNSSVDAFIELLPQTLQMKDLHSNEKYYYLDESLPTNTESVQQIKAGDLMLFGNDCIVLFYEDFSTTYSYTRLGHVDDVSSFVNEVGNGNVSVLFEK